MSSLCTLLLQRSLRAYKYAIKYSASAEYNIYAKEVCTIIKSNYAELSCIEIVIISCQDVGKSRYSLQQNIHYKGNQALAQFTAF